MSRVKLPEVTADDVLAGLKIDKYLKRDGSTIEIVVRSYNWRTALEIADLPVGSSSHVILDHCVEFKAQEERERVLNSLVPSELLVMASVAHMLSNGVDEAKKRASAKVTAPASQTISGPNAI